MVCFYFFESRKFSPKGLGLGFLTRILASRLVSDFTIRHPLKRRFLLVFFLLFCHLVIDIPLHLDLFSSFIFHSSEFEWAWCSGWLIPNRFSLSLLSGARGVMGRRKVREREVDSSSLLPSHHPLLLPCALCEDDWGWVRCSGSALVSHQCDPGSNPGVDAICGLSLLLVLSFATRGFSPGTLVFPSP